MCVYEEQGDEIIMGCKWAQYLVWSIILLKAFVEFETIFFSLWLK